MEPLFCGVDVGAAATKVVLLNGSGNVLARTVRHSGVDYAATARTLLEQGMKEAGVEGDITRTISTGYGRNNVDFKDGSLTEIHCHGIGCHHLVPGSICIVDIGGQDNKVIILDDSGHRLDFKMNRKCAAGTGAFIEEMAARLGIDIGEMDRLARSTEDVVKLSSFCTVFAKTEILAHLRKGESVAPIVRGAFVSVVHRVTEMAPLDDTVVLTGGVVAHNPTIAEILAREIGRKVTVPKHPQFTGALGAALIARKQHTE
jgi:predicted CoA-substrate-specific enzyme activase